MNRTLKTIVFIFVSLSLQSQIRFDTISIGEFNSIEIKGINRDIANKLNKQIILNSINEDKIDLSLDTYGILLQLQKNYQMDGNDLSSLTTTVNHAGDILSITITSSYYKANPSTKRKNLNFSTTSGECLKLEDIINNEGIKYIEDTIRKENEIRKKSSENPNIESLSVEEKNQLFEKYNPSNEYFSNFKCNENSFSFYINNGFTHTTEALEPENEFKISYAELNIYFIKTTENEEIMKDANSKTSKNAQHTLEKVNTNEPDFSSLSIGKGKVTCKVCIGKAGRVQYAELIEEETDQNVFKNSVIKREYLKVLYNSRFEISNKDCFTITKYH